jgi:hypothetical protein
MIGNEMVLKNMCYERVCVFMQSFSQTAVLECTFGLRGFCYVFVTLLFPNMSRGINALDAGREVGMNGRPEFFNEAERQRVHDAVTSAALKLKCPTKKNLKKIVLATARDQLEMRGYNPEAATLPSKKTLDKILKAATADVVKKPSTQNERRLLVLAFSLIFSSRCRQG